MCVTHGMPCVNMHGTLRAINMGAQIQFVGGSSKEKEDEGKSEREERRKERGENKNKKGKKKREEEKGGREEKERGNGRSVAQ